MPVPQIDFDNHAIQEIPEHHRTPRFIAWFQGLLRGSISWLNRNFYNYCFGDTISTFWLSGATYNLNDSVVTFFGVYISLQDGNIGNNPNNSPDYWYQISPSFIGAFERVQYNSQKIIMEYALNNFFRTIYRNPTTIVTGGYLPLSDIYIETVSPSFTSFVVYEGVTGTSPVYQDSTGTYAVFEDVVTPLDTTYEFIVWIPVSLSVALGAAYDKIIRSKVDLMSIFGTVYTVQTY